MVYTLISKHSKTSSPTPGMQKEEGESVLVAFGIHVGNHFSLSVLTSVGVVYGWSVRGV